MGTAARYVLKRKVAIKYCPNMVYQYQLHAFDNFTDVSLGDEQQSLSRCPSTAGGQQIARACHHGVFTVLARHFQPSSSFSGKHTGTGCLQVVSSRKLAALHLYRITTRGHENGHKKNTVDMCPT